MGYCLLLLLNICIVGAVSWYEWGQMGLVVMAGYALFIFGLPACPLSKFLISHFFGMDREVDDMLYLEKSVYLSFAVYKVIWKIIVTILAIGILIFLLAYDLIMVINSGGSYSIMDSFNALGRIYQGMAGLADRVIDSIVGTLTAVCNYVRRKRKGLNLTNPYGAETFWVGGEETGDGEKEEAYEKYDM